MIALSTNPLSLLAVGAATSVGLKASSAAAAIIAGISRPKRIREYALEDPETLEMTRLTGHPVIGLTDGFGSPGRHIQLVRAAIRDLLAQPGVPPLGDRFWEGTRRLIVSSAPLDQSLTSSEPLLAALRPLTTGTPACDHSALASAVCSVAPILASSGIQSLLMVFVDSLFDLRRLDALRNDDRLKCAACPTGLVPGEAAIALLVQSESSARRRSTPPLCRLTASASAETDSPATRLSECVLAVMPRRPSESPGAAICDLNGEAWRARLWGTMLSRTGSAFAPRVLWAPARSIGDTGCASGAVGACVGAHILLRPALGDQGPIAVVSSSENGAVGCLCLQRVGS